MTGDGVANIPGKPYPIAQFFIPELIPLTCFFIAEVSKLFNQRESTTTQWIGINIEYQGINNEY